MARSAILTGSWDHERARWSVPAWSVSILLLLVPVLMGAGGYVGGGGDDWYYLEAARCAAERGPCLPETHWAARFPLVLPMAASIALLGDSRWAVELVPFLYAVAALVLLTLNVERRFGKAAAAVAGLALALTPQVALEARHPMVDLPELVWILAGMLAIQLSLERNSHRLAALAGALIAVAAMTRASSFALLPLLGVGWLLLDARRRWLALPFGLAFAAVLGAEAAAYGWATGDPAYGWKLSLHHTRIPSSELPPTVDLSRGALLNLEFIRGWRRSMGIEVHWTIDPLLNLLADPACGLTLCGALAFGLARGGQWRRDRWLPLLASGAAIHFLLLTFVLAIDPKPRMFLPEIGVAAATIGVLGTHGWRSGSRGFLIVMLGLMAARLLLLSADAPRFRAAEAEAARWIGGAGKETLAIDETNRRVLTLLPEAGALARAEAEPLRPRLVLGPGHCGSAAGAVLRRTAFPASDPAPLAWARARQLMLRHHPPLLLCIVRPGGPA